MILLILFLTLFCPSLSTPYWSNPLERKDAMFSILNRRPTTVNHGFQFRFPIRSNSYQHQHIHDQHQLPNRKPCNKFVQKEQKEKVPPAITHHVFHVKEEKPYQIPEKPKINDTTTKKPCCKSVKVQETKEIISKPCQFFTTIQIPIQVYGFPKEVPVNKPIKICQNRFLDDPNQFKTQPGLFLPNSNFNMDPISLENWQNNPVENIKANQQQHSELENVKLDILHPILSYEKNPSEIYLPNSQLLQGLSVGHIYQPESSQIYKPPQSADIIANPNQQQGYFLPENYYKK